MPGLSDGDWPYTHATNRRPYGRIAGPSISPFVPPHGTVSTPSLAPSLAPRWWLSGCLRVWHRGGGSVVASERTRRDTMLCSTLTDGSKVDMDCQSCRRCTPCVYFGVCARMRGQSRRLGAPKYAKAAPSWTRFVYVWRAAGLAVCVCVRARARAELRKACKRWA